MEFNLNDYVNLWYVISTTLLTYLLLLLAFNTSKRWAKVLISVVSGGALGFVFWHFKLCEIQVLITSFFVSITFYEWIIKAILEKFNITTYNNIGIKI